jgi:arginyl-tRNA synthetase
MHWSHSPFILNRLNQLFLGQIKSLYPSLENPENFLEITTATQAKFGHYQLNSALKLAKALNKSPRDIAQQISEVKDETIASLAIAGPGFINITLSTSFLEKMLLKIKEDPRLGIEKTSDPKRVIVEFSSPNTAKELHVGHLRSTIIGDAIAHLFEFLGHDVLRLNHIGNWGTPFGMLICYLQEKHPKVLSSEEKTDLSHLAKWYKEARLLFDSDPNFKKRSQEQVVRLQAKEKEAMHCWEIICEISRQAYQEIYDLLDIQIHERGESYYHDDLPEIVRDLKNKNLITESDGAKCLFLRDFVSKEGEPLPMIVQKSDGGYNYSTTDLAAISQRIFEEKADRIIYVVDNGQSLHFSMVFEAAKLAGYLDPSKTLVEHVPFGLVLGSDGKKFKTRSGDSEKLIDLLNQAISKAKEVLSEREDISNSELDASAQALGISAVKYADLSSLRTKDYTFSYDKMLAFEGNTAAFLLYAYVRILSIQKKASLDLKVPIKLSHPTEIALAFQLLQMSEVLASISDSLLMNRLADYLYKLAEHFHAFFRDCRVVKDPLEKSRLILLEITRKTLLLGFQILGLKPVQKM